MDASGENPPAAGTTSPGRVSAPHDPAAQVSRPVSGGPSAAAAPPADEPLSHLAARVRNGAGTAGVRMRAGVRFLSVLSRPVPAPSAPESRTAEGLTIEPGGASPGREEDLACALAGIEAVATAADLPAGYRARLTAGLLARWKAVAEFREIWAPANAMALARTLSAIGAHPETPPFLRRDIVRALSLKMRLLSVAELVARVLAEGGDAASMDDLSATFAGDLLRMHGEADYRDREDRCALLRALAAVAGRRNPAPPPGGEPLRLRILRLLSDGARQGIDDARRCLDALAENRNVPPEVRARLARR